jgi:hypothetical protein
MLPSPLDGVWTGNATSHEPHGVDDGVAELHVVQVVSEYVHLGQLQTVVVAAVRVLEDLIGAWSVMVTFLLGILERDFLGIQPVDSRASDSWSARAICFS